MKRFRLVFAAVLVLTASTALGAKSVNQPSAVAAFILQAIYSHTPIPIDALAGLDPTVMAADEFHKQAAVDAAKAKLKAEAESLVGVTAMTVALNSSFSQYDSQNHEYTFDLNDASYMPLNYRNHIVNIALTNGTAAQTWSLPPAEAQKALEKNGGQRWVILALTLSLLDSSPPTDGENPTLNARIDSYDVLSGRGNIKLGHIVVGATQ